MKDKKVLLESYWNQINSQRSQGKISGVQI